MNYKDNPLKTDCPKVHQYVQTNSKDQTTLIITNITPLFPLSTTLHAKQIHNTATSLNKVKTLTVMMDHHFQVIQKKMKRIIGMSNKGTMAEFYLRNQIDLKILQYPHVQPVFHKSKSLREDLANNLVIWVLGQNLQILIEQKKFIKFFVNGPLNFLQKIEIKALS